MAFYSRGRNRIRNEYTQTELYNAYKEEVSDNSLYDVDKKTYYKVYTEFMKAVINEILFNGLKYKLPYNLGIIHVVKRPVRTDDFTQGQIDWKETIKHNKLIYHLNDHSNNFRYSFYWDKATTNKRRNIGLYKVVMSRHNKRLLAKIIKSGEQDYFEINRGK